MADINEYTKLMLHCNGADESTVFTDESPSAHGNATVGGTAQVDTAYKKWGTGSLMLDGDSDYLSYPDHVDWDILGSTSDDWTIDLWVKHTDHVGSETYISQWESVTKHWQIGHSHGNGIFLLANTPSSIFIVGGEITDSDWHHIAFCKVGADIGIYKDGTQIAYLLLPVIGTMAGSLYIGQRGDSAIYLDGHLDEIRIQHSNIFGANPNDTPDDTIDVPTGEYSLGTEELYDIDNDFRTMKTEAYNIDNDFRLSGTESILDINSDFRLSGASLVNVDNDFRMSINLEKIDINDDFRMVELNTPNINNKISTSKELADDISNKCSFLREKIIDVNNIVSFYISPLNNINNDIRTKSIAKSNINNDFRMLTEWIEPGDPGFQSFGHTYIKVYIGGNEQTDIKIDSIIISKILNGSHTATFDLARPYDDTKPSIDSSVEIKYREWTLYKGYVTDIVPTNSPESIRILCNDKHWQRNKVNKYFFVGHEPKDNTEKYYEHINEGLSECGFDFGIGDFIPQTINCFGIGESDCITSLVINSGNFAWYYDVNENKQLWKAGKGSIINLERQELDKNLHLHQVLRHQFRDSIINIINKFKVQMGDKIIKRFNRYGGSKEYAGYHYKWLTIYPAPMWDDDYEKLTKDSETGYGFDYHKPEDDDKYVNVFKKYKFWMFRNYEREDWTDRYPPQVTISKPFWGEWEAVPAFPKPEAWDLFPSKSNTIREGFTIDYDEGTLTFNTPHYFIRRNSRGEEIQRRKANVSLSLFKKKYWSRTEEPTDNPEEDITSPLMFFTDKMGDYPETIIDSLELSGLSIQEGGLHITGQEAYETLEWSPSQWKYITVTKYRNIWTDIPSWDDTEFARDYANWQLSKICDKKITGSIDVTLDTAVFYGINLSKRIMINGVMEIPLNIVSISYNIGNFTTTINLENPRNYRRSVSLQSRGEGE